MDDIRKFPGRFPQEPGRDESYGRRMPGYRGNQRSYREYNMEGNREEWRKPLPFYMTYPSLFWEEEDDAARDLEYFLQLYPREAQRYQKKISDILDTLDYNGSMIYDEYPDRMALYRLGEDIYEKIRREEEQEAQGRAAVEEIQAHVEENSDNGAGESQVLPENTAILPETRQLQSTSRSNEEWSHRKDMIQVLLYYEIFRRRHGRGSRGRSVSYGSIPPFGANNGFFKF